MKRSSSNVKKSDSAGSVIKNAVATAAAFFIVPQLLWNNREHARNKLLTTQTGKKNTGTPWVLPGV